MEKNEIGAASEAACAKPAVLPPRVAFPGGAETKLPVLSDSIFLRGQAGRVLNSDVVPVGLSPSAISRFVAGALAALWALAGLANDYVTMEAAGLSIRVVISAACNIFLTAGASLAFVNANGWRTVMLVALVCVSADRVASAIGSGAVPAQVTAAAVAFLAIAAVTLTARTRA